MQKNLLLFFALTGLLAHLSGQTCSGSLGENIFTEGDFGTGVDYILLTDPQIAPGYSYSTTTPVSDGRYTITNNVGLWANSYNWLKIGDNSPDPYGYMMVVNASYTPGLFYNQTVTGLCDGTTYEFSADLFNLIGSGGNMIKPNVSFLIDSVVVYNTGDVPENNQWNTYGFTFSTKPGQGSVTLSLRNNAPGGNGNDLAIDNISFRPCGPQAFILPAQTAYACQEGSPIPLRTTVLGNQYPTPYVQWQQSLNQGQTWANIPGANDSVYLHTNLSGGLYYYRFLVANSAFNLQNSKCRVVSTPKLVEVLPKFYTAQDTFCQGLAYQQGRNSYTQSGTYIDTLISSRGCDSIVTLELFFIPDEEVGAKVNGLDPTCSDKADGSIRITSVVNGTPPLSYFFNGQPYYTNSLAVELPGGPFICSVSDRYGCRFDTTINLVSPPLFAVDLSPDWEVELGDSVVVSSTGTYPIVSYTWEPEGVVDCQANCSPLSFTPATTLDLVVHALNEKGCLASDTVLIQVNKVRHVYLPDAFTPNGDGLNEVFSPVASLPNVTEVEEMRIYDRWGLLVFENTHFNPTDLSQGWAGNFQGKDVPSGVYAYVTRVRFLDGQLHTFSGALTLVR